MSRRKWSMLIGLIGSVVFNVGWWISYPPMVFAGVPQSLTVKDYSATSFSFSHASDCASSAF